VAAVPLSEDKGFIHLVKGRRDAGFLDPLMDEHEQFVLLAGEHGGGASLEPCALSRTKRKRQ
jgi:hypothetical protein